METPQTPRKPLGFGKTVLAAFLGFLGANVVTSILGFVAFILFIASLTFLGGSSSSIEPGSVLKINMNTISEIATTDDWMNFLSTGQDRSPAVSLTQALSSIRKAKSDDRIRGIYLNVEGYEGGLASTNDLREALQDFRKSGKFIVAYADSYTQRGYYLSSVADQVILNPQGGVNLIGISSGTLMMHGALEKLGIKAEIFKVGTYKGAVEPYALDKLSEPNRQQISEYIHGLWNHILKGISSARRVSVDSLRSFADQGLAFGDATEAVRYRLVDTLAYRLDVEDLIAKRLGVKKPEDVHQVLLSDLIAEPDPAAISGANKEHRIAVIYAEGEITGGGLAESGITEALVRELRELRREGKAKAVVLRVNSPGGSAFLSDQLWHEVTELRKQAKVVVSMGDVAASGGYYMSAGADAIVASPVTLTGSIGIFGMLPDASVLAQRLGLSVDVVSTSPYASMESSNLMGFNLRALTDDERGLIQRQVERGYETFLARVGAGRHMSRAAVDSIAQGRVWLGEKAKSLGLVDELGGLETAIRLAAKLAGFGSDYVVDYGTSTRSFFDGYFAPVANRFTARLHNFLQSEQDRKLEEFMRLSYRYSGLQARLPYDYMPY